MAPEQFRGDENGDCRTDVYQVGAVLYHMITGHPPFRDVRKRIRRLTVEGLDTRPPLDGVPRGMDSVILRCLQSDPARRHQDIRALEGDLRGCLWEPTDGTDQSPTIVQHIPDLNRQELGVNL